MNNHPSFFRISLLALLFLSLTMASCKRDKDDPDDPNHGNEEELITTLRLQFEEDGNPGNTFTVTFADPDGPGGNAPTVTDTIRLASGLTYNVTAAVLNESDAANVEDITLEVQTEGDEHLFCYTAQNATVLVTRTDSDGTHPIGITSQWTTSGSGTGSMLVSLKHQPNGTKDGTCTPGETDVEVNFVMEIQ